MIGGRTITKTKGWNWYRVSHPTWPPELVYKPTEEAARHVFWSFRDKVTVERTDLSFTAGLREAGKPSEVDEEFADPDLLIDVPAETTMPDDTRKRESDPSMNFIEENPPRWIQPGIHTLTLQAVNDTTFQGSETWEFLFGMPEADIPLKVFTTRRTGNDYEGNPSKARSIFLALAGKDPLSNFSGPRDFIGRKMRGEVQRRPSTTGSEKNVLVLDYETLKPADPDGIDW